jgi:hypothetical protein
MNFQALEIYDGQHGSTWRFEPKSNRERILTATADLQTVYVLTFQQTEAQKTSFSHTLTAVTLNGKNTLWHVPLPPLDPAASGITLQLTGSMLTLGSSRGLVGFDKDTGALLWQRADCHTPLTTSSRSLLAMCQDEGVVQLDPSSGATLSVLEEGSPPDSLALSEEYAALAWRQQPVDRLAAPSVRLVFYRLADGSQVWNETETGDLFGLLPVNNDVIYRIGNQVIRRRLADGGLVWQTELPDWVGNNLLLAPGILLIGSRVGYLHALEPATGYVFWTQDLWSTVSTHPMSISPIAAEGGLLARVDGQFVALNGVSSEQLEGMLPSATATATATAAPTMHDAWMRTPIPPPQANAVLTPPLPYTPTGDDAAWLQSYVRFLSDLLHRTQNNVAAFRETLLTTWPNVSDLEPAVAKSWVHAEDLDNDGQLEWLVAAPLVHQLCSDSGCKSVVVCSGDSCQFLVFLFEVENDSFVPVHRFRGLVGYPLDAMSAPRLLAAADINQDGYKEIVLADVLISRASSVTVFVGQWDGQTWHDLSQAGSINRYANQVWLEDRDGDGRQEIVLHGGVIDVAWMALQRAHTWVYAWQDSMFKLVADIPDPVDHAYFLMRDANTALAKGDWNQALTLARKALTANLSAGEYWERASLLEARLRSYAAIEAMLIYAQHGEIGAMKALLNLIDERYQIPGNPYADAAHVLWDVYQTTEDPLIACKAMARAVRNRWPEARFQALLTEAEALTPQQICPLATTGYPRARVQSRSTVTPTPVVLPSTQFTPEPVIHLCRDGAGSTSNAAHGEVGEAIAYYLSCLGSDINGLNDFLARWLDLPRDCGKSPFYWKRVADLDQDGQNELLFAYATQDPCNPVTAPFPTWVVYEQTGQGYRRIFDAAQVPSLDALFKPPEIGYIGDLNSDGQNELVVYTFWSGAMHDFKTMSLHRWNGQTWTILAEVRSAYNQYTGATQWSDENGDGMWEYVVDGGDAGSVNVLSRQHRRFYGWWNGQFALLQDTPKPSDHPYFLIMDANQALANHEPNTALTLATKTLTEQFNRVGEWGYYDDATQKRMLAYAASLAMLVYAERGEIGAMRAVFQHATSVYNQANNPYMDALTSLWRTFQATEDAEAACIAMALKLRQRGDIALWVVPFVHPAETIPPQRLCPLAVN